MNTIGKHIIKHREEWWASRRLKYNKGLVIAATSAFILYAILGSVMIPPEEDFEVTAFSIFFQGIGYLVMMGVANLLYNLGEFTDHLFNAKNDDKFRLRIFNLGYWFSVGLPFLIPAMIVVLYGFR